MFSANCVDVLCVCYVLQRLIRKTLPKNGKWGNGEWGMVQWGMGNCSMGNGEWGMNDTNGEWYMNDSKWGMVQHSKTNHSSFIF